MSIHIPHQAPAYVAVLRPPPELRAARLLLVVRLSADGNGHQGETNSADDKATAKKNQVCPVYVGGAENSPAEDCQAADAR